MVGWHHRLDGHEFEQVPGVGDRQVSLVCCSSQGRKELDMTEWLNWTPHPSLHLPFEARDCVFSPFQCWDYVLSSSSRSLILWDNRRARPTLLDSPQTTNTLDTESPSRNASRCSWPSSRAPSSEDVLTFHVSSAACQHPRDFAARLFSLWAWKLAPTLAPRIRSHLCLRSCLLWSSHGSIPVQGEIFEYFRTLNHCQIIKMISKSCYFVCCGKKGVV